MNLIDRWGKCYAVITGGSQGLGKEYAKELAKNGFDLILIARDKNKLKET